MDLTDIRENYRNFDDEKIEIIATEEVGSLRPEVIFILKEEIARRNLDKNLVASIDLQTRVLTETEFKEYYEILRNHSCPTCNSRTNKINATMVGQVVSIILLTNYEKRLKVACSDCLDTLHKKANIKSALLGWWAFPWGPIQTIRSFIFNSSMKRYNRTEKPNEIFSSFVKDNIGILEGAKTDPNKLTVLINRTNYEMGR